MRVLRRATDQLPKRCFEGEEVDAFAYARFGRCEHDGRGVAAINLRATGVSVLGRSLVRVIGCTIEMALASMSFMGDEGAQEPVNVEMAGHEADR
jgi:hypothetical protein